MEYVRPQCFISHILANASKGSLEQQWARLDEAESRVGALTNKCANMPLRIIANFTKVPASKGY